jgi:hypothetical protein
MTYYDILQVTHTASPEVIQMAYKALARKYHPDVFQGDKAYAEVMMKQINEAYRILSSPILRAQYDQIIAQRTQNPNSKNNYNSDSQSSYTQPQQSERPHTPPQDASSKKNGITLRPFLVLFLFLVPMVLITLLLFDYIGTTDNNGKVTEQVVSTNKPAEETTPNYEPVEKVPTIEVERVPVAAPISGYILSGSEVFNASEITVTASYNADCVVKLKTSTGSTVISFYVRAGETVTMGVPANYLYVYFASGDTWYGKDDLFGENTYYSKDDDLLDFTEYTWEYTLTPVTSGNFSETPIDASEFN